MKKLLFLLIICGSICQAQNLSYQSGARSAAVAHASATFTDVWAAHHNQAGLAFLEDPSIAVFASQRYSLSDLNKGAVALAYPSDLGTIGLSFSYFGFELYNESKIGLNYARSFGKRISFGLQINYHSFYVEEGTGEPQALTFEAGLLAKPMENLHLAFHVFNPTHNFRNSDTEERLPVILRFGARYSFSEKVNLMAELLKNQNYDERYAMGFEYEVIENFALRTGVGLQPLRNTFGIGYKLRNFTANLSYEYAQVLGSTGGIGLQYAF